MSGPKATRNTHHSSLAGARLAPSAHNTQPWRFAPLPDGRIAVGWDPARTLAAGDPTNRDLYLTLGAAVESARLRASLTDQPLAFQPAGPDETATIGYLLPGVGPRDRDDRRLAQALERRQTARVPHSFRAVPPETLTALRDQAAVGGCRLLVVTERPAIRRLAALARQATAWTLADEAIHAELWRWLRLDRRDPTYHRDGLTADCLELRRTSLAIARLVLPPARMRRLTRLGFHHLLAQDTRWLVQLSASICLLLAPSSARNDLVATGRVLQRIWLRASQAGLSSHPVSALLDCPATVAPTLAVIGAGDWGVPAAIFRLGFCPPVARAPRLPLAELIVDTTTVGGPPMPAPDPGAEGREAGDQKQGSGNGAQRPGTGNREP